MLDAPSTPILAAALSTTVVKLSDHRTLFSGWSIYNPNVTEGFVQVFDVADPTTVQLGTTTPKFSIPLNKSGITDREAPEGIGPMQNGCCVAATTTATGNTALGTAVDALFLLQ